MYTNHKFNITDKLKYYIKYYLFLSVIKSTWLGLGPARPGPARGFRFWKYNNSTYSTQVAQKVDHRGWLDWSFPPKWSGVDLSLSESLSPLSLYISLGPANDQKFSKNKPTPLQHENGQLILIEILTSFCEKLDQNFIYLTKFFHNTLKFSEFQ